MIEGNYHKFSQHESLKEFLLATHAKVLVEASPYNTILGIGLAATDDKAMKSTLWRGENLLGFALMIVRDRLQNK